MFLARLSLSYILLLFISNQHARGHFKIGRMDSPDHTLIMRSAFEAYKRLNMSVEFVEFPGKRALEASNSGWVDAELSRIFEVGDKYPNLRRVPTPIFWFEATAFSKRRDIKVQGWESLKGLRVGIMRGMLFSEKRVQGFPRVTVVNGPKSLFRMLEYDRVDVVIFSDLNGRFVLKDLGLKDVKAISPGIETIFAYHYVHKKHEHLVPRLDAVFREMRDSGQFEKFRQEFLEQNCRKQGPEAPGKNP